MFLTMTELPRDARRHAVGLDLVLGEDVGDDVRDVVQLHDLAVDDGVGLETLRSRG